MMKKVVPKEDVVELIISQLKQYSYFSIAKQLADQVGSNPEPSNELAELCGIADYTKPEPLDMNDMGINVEEDHGGIVFDGQDRNLRLPNYHVKYTTQHREVCRTAGIAFIMKHLVQMDVILLQDPKILHSKYSMFNPFCTPVPTKMIKKSLKPCMIIRHL
jgi:hypothetical protein